MASIADTICGPPSVAVMLQCCVRLSPSVVACNVYIVAKRYVLKQKLLLTPTGSRIWGNDWYQNEWHCL